MPLHDAGMHSPSYRNFVFAAMLLSMVLGYLPWYNFSAVQKYIADEYMLTVKDTGTILAAFQTGYVVLVPLAGWLGDKFGPKNTVFWATASTGIFSTALALGKWTKGGILVLRLLTGVTAGAIYVPGLALLSRWFPAEKRGNVLGAYTGALVTAYAGGYFLAAPLAAVRGWRAGILWTSLPAFLAALIIALFVKDPPTSCQDIPVQGPTAVQPRSSKQPLYSSTTTPVSTIAPAPQGGIQGPVLLTIAYMGHMWEQYAFWGWLGPFMVAVATASGMNPDKSVVWGGRTAALVILLGAPASWIWGNVTDHKGRTWAIAVAATLSITGEMLIGFVLGRSLIAAVIVASWIGFWVVADSAIYKAALIEMSESRVTGLYLGLQSAVGYMVTIVAPVVFSKTLEAFNGAVPASEMRVWAPAFIALGTGALFRTGRIIVAAQTQPSTVDVWRKEIGD